MKPYSSMRIINYHSHVPYPELLNTYAARLVTASCYDTGGGFLQGYHTVLEEMWSNSLPTRVMSSCLLRACWYGLGRCADLKRHWLQVLSILVDVIELGGSTYDDFVYRLSEIFIDSDCELDAFVFNDDVAVQCALPARVPVVRPSGGKIVVPWRGPQSDECLRLLRENYPNCMVAVSHPRHYSARHLFMRGAERMPAEERVAQMDQRRKRRVQLAAGAVSSKRLRLDAGVMYTICPTG